MSVHTATVNMTLLIDVICVKTKVNLPREKRQELCTVMMSFLPLTLSLERQGAAASVLTMVALDRLNCEQIVEARTVIYDLVLDKMSDLLTQYCGE